jgi:hypothetical protein
MSEWQPIESASKEEYDLTKVDLWMQIGADAFRVVDCWRFRGEWVHDLNHKVEPLIAGYITHWMPRPAGPNGESGY